MADSSSIDILLKILFHTFLIASLVGYITNIISFVIFSGKTYKNTVYSVYYRFSALLCIFLSLIMPINKYVEFNFDVKFWNYGDGLCKFRMYAFYSLQSVQGWTHVVVSIDRYLSIVHPFIFATRRNLFFQIIVCCGVFVYNLVYNSPFLLFNVKTTNRSSVSVK